MYFIKHFDIHIVSDRNKILVKTSIAFKPVFGNRFSYWLAWRQLVFRMQFAVCNSQLNSQLHSRMQFAIQNILQCLYTKGANTIGVGLRGQTTTHVKIYSLVKEIRTPPPPTFNEAKSNRARKHPRPLPGGPKF